MAGVNLNGLLNSKWGGPIVVAALLSGVGNGAADLLFRDTSDRIHRTTVVEWREQDRERVEDLRDELHDHLLHSAVYTSYIDELRATIQRYEERIDELEKQKGP